jgi:hypothetical protein
MTPLERHVSISAIITIIGIVVAVIYFMHDYHKEKLLEEASLTPREFCWKNYSQRLNKDIPSGCFQYFSN